MQGKTFLASGINMEPASVLTQAALAAVALVPTQPRIEVHLRNVENKTAETLNFLQWDKNEYKDELIGPIEHGSNWLNMPLVLEEDSNGNLWASTLTFTSVDNVSKILHFALAVDANMDWRNSPGLELHCEGAGASGYSSQKIVWGRQNLPKYIFVEIDGVISEDWSGSTFSIHEEKIWLEKLK